jgi:hypothetical protein
MNSNDQALAHSIKLKFGTAPSDPSDYQLSQIKKEIQALVNKGITPSASDWSSVVKKYCPNTGNYFYGGADTSDLVTLLQMATKSGA